MSSENWFIKIESIVMGPLSSKDVLDLLKKGRIGRQDGLSSCAEGPWKANWQESDLEPVAPKQKQLKEINSQVVPARERQSFQHIRDSDRHPVEGFVCFDGRERYPMVNLSEQGLFFESEKSLPIGQEISFSLLVPGTELASFNMQGMVIRSGKSFRSSKLVAGYGVEFVRMNPAAKRLLSAFLSRKVA